MPTGETAGVFVRPWSMQSSHAKLLCNSGGLWRTFSGLWTGFPSNPIDVFLETHHQPQVKEFAKAFGKNMCGLINMSDGLMMFHDHSDWPPKNRSLLSQNLVKKVETKGALGSKWNPSNIFKYHQMIEGLS